MKQLVATLNRFLPASLAGAVLPAQPVRTAPSPSYVAYAHGVTALAAKLACADGIPVRAEFTAFDTLFAFDGLDAHVLRRLFLKHAQDDAASALQYARSLASLDLPLAQREELLRRLCLLAACDGLPNLAEIETLWNIASTLAVAEPQWRELIGAHVGLRAGAHPHEILGVAKRTSAEALRTRYIERIRQMHPDQLAGKQVAPAVQRLLEEVTRAVTAAYEILAKPR